MSWAGWLSRYYMKRASPEPPFVQMYIEIGSNALISSVLPAVLFLTWFRQDKTRQDIYYHNIASTISWHTVSKKNASRGVRNQFYYKSDITDNK